MNTPTWLKISRVGNLFSYYYSTDGLAWTSAGSITLALNSSLFAEAFAGSGAGISTSITASMEQVSIQNLANPTYSYSGLSPSTSYSLTAYSRDVANNDSAVSPTLTVATSSVATPAYTLRSVGAAANGFAGVLAAKPSGVVIGDLLLLRADCRNNTDTFTTPSGWTKISPNVNVTYSDLYARIADGTGTDTPPAMASVGGNQIIVQCACFTGSVWTGGLGSIVHVSVDKAGTSTSIPYSARTISLANCLIIAWGAHNKTAATDSTTLSNLSGFSQIDQQAPAGNSMNVWWGYQQQTTATNIPADTQTRTGTAENSRYMSEYIALKTT